MAEENVEPTVAQRLGHLLDRGLLPAGGPAEAAERLIERLERPARVALLGLPGAGKSAILNLLAGTVIVPETLRLPTIIVQHGAEPRMLCTLADGRVEVIEGADLSKVLTLNPALVTLEMDLPALKVISLLEVSAGPVEAEQRRAAIWASKRADILIWCTTSYLPKEQVVWDALADAVKDNGFLFLTKVDLLGSREATQGMLERVEMRAGEEFRQVLSISAKQARAAIPPGGPINRDLFRDSGAAAVITTIKTRVQMARRADTDMAELLLARHVEAGELVARRFADVDPVEPAAPPETREWTPPPEATRQEVPVPVQGQVPAGESVVRPLVEPEAEPVPEPEPVAEVQPEPQAEAELEPEQDHEPEPLTNAVPAKAPPPAGQAAPGSKRFSDRIKQIPPPEEAAAASQVPLRTTWKSRAETAAAAAAGPDPDPAATPGPQSHSRASAPPADTGPDDSAIAAMLAAAAALPTGARVAKERPSRAPSGSDAPAPADRPARAQLFGARKSVADAETPEVDLSALRMSPDADAAALPEPPAREPAASAPVDRARAAPNAPDLTDASPATEPEATTAPPRVAVLRDRRPDAAASERRERPRIAARIVAPPPSPVTPMPVSGVEQALLDEAIAIIIARSANLAGQIVAAEKLPVDLILEHGRDTAEQLIEVLSRANSVEMRRINGDLSEIQDLIMLMLLEKGHAPADDALTLLLQFRRELETLRAA